MNTLTMLMLAFLILPLGLTNGTCAEIDDTVHTGAFDEDLPTADKLPDNDHEKKYKIFMEDLRKQREELVSNQKDTRIIDDIIKLTEEMLELAKQQDLMHKATKEFAAAAEKMTVHTNKIFLDINDTLVDYYNAEVRREKAIEALQGSLHLHHNHEKETPKKKA